MSIITNTVNGDTFKCLFETLIREHTVEFHGDDDMKFNYANDYRYNLVITIGEKKFVVNRVGEIVEGSSVTVAELNNELFRKIVTAWRAFFGKRMPDFRTLETIYNEFH